MASSDRSPPPARAEPILSWDRAQTAVAALAGLAGLGVYVYLRGGIVAWLRAVAARLPADNVTPAFENRHLVALGMKVPDAQPTTPTPDGNPQAQRAA